VTRPRNFSPWAYWSLHLASIVERDPAPVREADARLAVIDAWRARVRVRLDELLGPEPAKVEPRVEYGEATECGDHVRHRVVFDSEAAMSVPAYLLVPHRRAVAGSGILAVHGHGPGKDLVCGLVGDGAEHYALQLVRAGHVVLAPDLRCFGERQDPQWDPTGHKYDCDWNLVAATMAGVLPVRQNLWDLQRGLDVLAAHPLVDPSRLGAAGFSYGATMTLLLAACDERVRAAVASGYVSSWRAAHAVPWNMCGSQIMFGQLGAIEHVDLVSLIAPRPLLVETGSDDPLFPLAAARVTVEQAERVWRAYGAAADALEHDVFDGDHRWNGAGVEAFLALHLGPGASSGASRS
jgi:hypothetical protein